MAIKFLLSADDDLIWDIDDHSEPITEQQAMIIAVRQMAGSLGAIAEVLAQHSSAATAKPQAPKASAKRATKRRKR
ncbi:MAG TPA: hypothetical protein VE914_09430 [Candidatus Angelobacter sp.]|nr:hypothetical protein [Candidatus Angelobacter sp.]